MKESPIVIKGARVHNLRNITVTIPQNSLTVITGLSGSGKSSLAFDTLYAEGQRRYVESLSTYARQFLGQMDKADVDGIDGLSPAIAIEQRTTQRNPRSTVGTVTEIHDHLRLLWARTGVPHCPKCGREVMAMSVQGIVESALHRFAGRKVTVFAPVALGKKGTFRKELEAYARDGFLKARIDGAMVALTDCGDLAKSVRHDIEVVVDRVSGSEDNRQRLTEAVELGLRTAGGVVVIESAAENSEVARRELYAESATCPDCGIGIEPLDPKHFSFNSPHGACPECLGLGVHYDIDEKKIIGDANLSLEAGCIIPWGDKPQKKWFGRRLRRLADDIGFSLLVSWKDLSPRIRKMVLYGSEGASQDDMKRHWNRRKRAFEGIVRNMQRRYKETTSSYIREWIEKFMTLRQCPGCFGERLKETSRAVRVQGERLPDLEKKTVGDVDAWLEALAMDETRRRISLRLIEELRSRLGFLKEVGLEYLTLDRSAATLSGGEAQRIRLATQLGSRLRGVLYVLDEPSVGLHPVDTAKLMRTLKELRDLGNTVVVVEHDRETIEGSDHVIDMGPGAGRHGGLVVAEGSPECIAKNENSLTGAYLSGRRAITHDRLLRPRNRGELSIQGVTTNNLRGVDVSFPIGNLVCVSGVSGSGKSSLVMDTLQPAVTMKLGGVAEMSGKFESLCGCELLDKVIAIDQSAIGRTSRSNPATYTGLFTTIRELFTRTRDARERGYGPGRFSFNVKGGRCEECQGAGVKVVEMHFLPDVYIDCEVCHGRRYNRETLEVKYKSRSIAEVLGMTVDEGREFFASIPSATRWLRMLQDVGLGYLQLGQSATTLSGGEAQRLKLASELGRATTGRTLYILDEPTTGLHMEDVRILMGVLDRLVDRGDTVVIVEHHPDVMAHADFIIDLGPGSGAAGGRVVAADSPEKVSRCRESLTGAILRPFFA